MPWATELSALQHLLAVERELHNLGYGNRIRIDLSEVGSQPYHSGVVFQAYLPDGDAPVASGGRYDGLLKRFGFDAPSVGFAVMSRRLQSRLPSSVRSSAPSAEPVSGETFKARVEAARALRMSGKVARL